MRLNGVDMWLAATTEEGEANMQLVGRLTVWPCCRHPLGPPDTDSDKSVFVRHPESIALMVTMGGNVSVPVISS